eukprot:scaffold460873_cov27-Prasinocladus_malaysianus.AAC.1
MTGNFSMVKAAMVSAANNRGHASANGRKKENEKYGCQKERKRRECRRMRDWKTGRKEEMKEGK